MVERMAGGQCQRMDKEYETEGELMTGKGMESLRIEVYEKGWEEEDGGERG
jgi:hypothetical protein